MWLLGLEICVKLTIVAFEKGGSQSMDNTVKLPVGIDDFKELRTEGFYYVDKTSFIKELLDNWGKANLFTRPRRFGKSLNMSMLKHFFAYNRKIRSVFFFAFCIRASSDTFMYLAKSLTTYLMFWGTFVLSRPETFFGVR